MTLLKPKAIALLLTLCGLTQIAAALPEDRDKPIYGNADQTQIEANSGKTVMTQNVVIRQGLLSIYADKVTIERNNDTGQFSYMLAQGNPVKFTDAPSVASEIVEVQGQVIEFFPDQDLIITIGNAQIQMNGNSAKGERIRYNTVTGLMTIESEKTVNENSSGAQAEFVLQPGTGE